MYQFPASELQLFLAKRDAGRGAWLTEEDVVKGGSETTGLESLDVVRARLRRVGLSNMEVSGVGEEDEAIRKGTVNVLVKLPGHISGADLIQPAVRIATMNELFAPEKYAEECRLLDEWAINAVHKIPSICEFMRNLGGCTKHGQIYWRMEDKQVVSVLLEGWLLKSSPKSSYFCKMMQGIVVGSPGVGKSTMLCMMAFYLVFSHNKNVLVYRRMVQYGEKYCLIYIGHENSKVVQFTVSECDKKYATAIYRELRQKGISNVWLLMDGFLSDDIPEGLRTFKMLTTSQQVTLKSGEKAGTYCCLLPCWSKTDLLSLGSLIFNYTVNDMEKRFAYSGGSVRDFTRAGLVGIRNQIHKAVSSVDDVFSQLSNSNTLTGRSQVDRLRHTFVKDKSDQKHYLYREYWVQVIDSEYALSNLLSRLQSDALFRIYTWSKSAGPKSLTRSVFKIYIHRLAADKMLRLSVSEYDPPERRKPNEERYFEGKQVGVKNGGALHSGTASDHVNDLTQWRDADEYAYWFPFCHDFPNIDSIVKLERKRSSSKKSNVAYLQITVEAEHKVDGTQLQKMNEIFYPDHVKNAGDTEAPIYIAVCPDLESCKALVLKPPLEVLAMRNTCRLYVGYYHEVQFATATDGTIHFLPIQEALPSPPYNFRAKRLREE
ncbi:unnamed protein product [Peronospora belbahrii]|uniref:Crinkler (CRN) family protein n=1 Tax=Peronospora belbahrii TaxID=622444 RepID=A0AAU9LKR0_9STRA|nr:unnamed protein product [Peronospora belbahrii]